MLKTRHYAIPLMLCPLLAFAQGVPSAAKPLAPFPSPVRAPVVRYVDLACDSTSDRTYIIVRRSVIEPCAQARQASLLKTVAVVGGSTGSAVALWYKTGQFQRNVTEVQVKEAMDIFFVPQRVADYSTPPVTSFLKKSVLRTFPPAALIVGAFFGMQSHAFAATLHVDASDRGPYDISKNTNVGAPASFESFGKRR